MEKPVKYSPDFEQGWAFLRRIKEKSAVYDAKHGIYICWNKDTDEVLIRQNLSLEKMFIIAHDHKGNGEVLDVPDIKPVAPGVVIQFLDATVQTADGLLFDATSTGIMQLESLIVAQNLHIY